MKEVEKVVTEVDLQSGTLEAWVRARKKAYVPLTKAQRVEAAKKKGRELNKLADLRGD
jgi:hypothetical protein